MKFIYEILLFVLISNSALASTEDAWRIYSQGDKNKYPKLIAELVEDKMYFSAVPFVKEYLVATSRANDKTFDEVIDKLIYQVGIKQFEVMPTNILEKSNAVTIRYILAKKNFRIGKYETALKYLNKNIEDWHPVKPFSLMLEASIYSIQKKEQEAINLFKECIDVSDENLSNEKNPNRIRQLKINRDYCIVGIARTQFANSKFEDAYLSYLDLSKNSFVWPEVLFEEAWNSFYLKDYNRTLGKLVSYKAPVFDYIFNPEIDVLKGLTYLELCLWGDSIKTVEDFYAKNEKDYELFKKFISNLGKDYKQFYLIVKDNQENPSQYSRLISKALTSISRDPAYIELFEAFVSGKEEIERMKQVRNSNMKAVLNENLKETLTLQRNILGSYIRGQLQIFSTQMIRAFEDMSYIKLEVLSKKKNELYGQPEINENGKRGSLANLKRTDKQYFWTFNGEFWADELGDYVFSLKSECR